MKKNKELGLCINCKNKALKNHTLCKKHLENARITSKKYNKNYYENHGEEYNKDYYKNHKEEISKKSRERYIKKIK